MASTTAITDAEFQSQVIDYEGAVLVDFWATWCGPCRAIAPLLEEVAQEFDGKIKIVKMDTDANPSTPSQFGIRSIPTLIFFKDGKKVDVHMGTLSKTALVAKVEAAIAA